MTIGAAEGGGRRVSGEPIPPCPAIGLSRPLPLAALAVLLACCGDSPAEPARTALDALADRADAGYDATVRACLDAERAALAVSPTREVWDAARDRLRGVCDPVVAVWEEARAAHEAAHAAVDACERVATAECFDQAIGVVAAAGRAAQHAADAWSAARGAIGTEAP